MPKTLAQLTEKLNQLQRERQTKKKTFKKGRVCYPADAFPAGTRVKVFNHRQDPRCRKYFVDRDGRRFRGEWLPGKVMPATGRRQKYVDVLLTDHKLWKPSVDTGFGIMWPLGYFEQLYGVHVRDLRAV